MINLKDKLKAVVNSFKKEPVAISEGFKRLEKVKKAAVETRRKIEAERARYGQNQE